MRQSTAKLAQVHTSLRTASEIARSTPTSAAELARLVKSRHPEISAAQCRRAVDQVLEVRGTRRRSPARKIDPIAARLIHFKTGRVIDRFRRSGFRDACCGDTLIVQFGPVASVARRTSEGWKDYKSHGYRMGITDQRTLLTVPSDWTTRIARRGLDSTAGLFTLDASPIAGDFGPGVEVYAASWIRQGRGTALETERGVIAYHRPTGTTYHSTKSDPKSAVSGLRRQLKQQTTPPELLDAQRQARAAARQARRSEQVAGLVDRVRKYDLAEIEAVRVSLEDSHRAGNCKPGTLAFADRFFPDRDTEETTIGEIARRVRIGEFADLDSKDLELARQLAAACLVAIRRDKRSRRLVTA